MDIAFNFVEIALVALLLSLLVALIMLPLLVWSFCQEAPRPTWQLGLSFVLLLVTPPLGVFFVLLYTINIVITHKAREREKADKR